MKFVIRHEIRGRVRVHFYQKEMSIRQADLLHYYLCTLPGVKAVRVYERTADAAVVYEGSRGEIPWREYRGFLMIMSGFGSWCRRTAAEP